MKVTEYQFLKSIKKWVKFSKMSKIDQKWLKVTKN